MVYSKSKFPALKKNQMVSGVELRLGRNTNLEKHPQKVGVKAVTYHRMEIIKEFDKVTLEFILDI